MPHLASAFRRLLEPLDRRLVGRIVDPHHGSRGVGDGTRAWICERHLETLLFAQFAGLQSLRDIEQALAARPAGPYHLGLRPPCRTTLSDASAARPAAVFRDLGATLAAVPGRTLRRQGQDLIRLLDASPIPLRDGRFTWAEADARCRGLELHIVHDPRAGHPVRFAVTSPKASDIALARQTPLEKGATHVFDKGFTDCRWWQDIVQAGACFVTRLKSDVRRRGNADHQREDGRGGLRRAAGARRMPAKGCGMAKVRLEADGAVTTLLADGTTQRLPPKHDWSRVDSTTEADIRRQAADDDREALADAAAWARRVRSRLGLSQAAFAARIGVPVATVRNWEQGKRVPRGPARALLRVLGRVPEAAMAALDEALR